MIERVIFALALVVIGFLSYRGFTRSQLRRIATTNTVDPILDHMPQNVPAIVYFTTPTCIPCQTQQKPALRKIQNELGNAVQIVEIDATQQPDDANRWGVMSAPTTFIIDRDGNPRHVNHGVADASKLRKQLLELTA